VPVPVKVVHGHKAKWLQRACLWLLDRFGCRWEAFETEDRAVYREVSFDENDIVDHVRQIEGAIELIWQGDKEILCGPQEFAGLARQLEDLTQPFAFNARMQIGWDREVKVFGMKVRVIPWMRGILIAPKDSKS
jgi:hypothetical protein